jgi:signal transduction histidine kinase
MSNRTNPSPKKQNESSSHDEYIDFVIAEYSRLMQENKHLRRLVAAQNEAISSAAHNLKNPLTSIILSASMMQKRLVEETIPENLESQTKRYLSNILSIAERMSQILSRLLDARRLFSETELSQHRLQSAIHEAFEGSDQKSSLALKIQAIELEPLLRLLVEEYRLRASEKGIIIKYEEQLSKAAWIHADRCATTEIMENLFSNAIKYSEPDSVILVRLVEEKGSFGERSFRVAVEDSGAGMSADEVERVFQANAGISNKPTHGEESHGIGLSIAKRYADAMSFSLKCRSHKGAGTQFILTLPSITG